MKIGFIMGRADPGDGIARYSQNLAEELARQGVSVAMLACNDDQGTAEGDHRTAGGIPITVIPRGVTVSERLQRTKLWRAEHAPSVLSLQFNCHQLGDRQGILRPFTELYRAAFSGLPLQITFHELWYDAYAVGSIGNWLKGQVRKHFLHRFLRIATPGSVVTPAEPYATALRRIGIKAESLPNFSNIPVSPFRVKSPWVPAFAPDFLTASIFGTIAPQAGVHDLVGILPGLANSVGRKLRVFGIGRHGYGGRGWQDIVTALGTSADCHALGFLSDADVSLALQNTDIGVSATDFAYCGKSASVAAMLAHSLPVIFSEHGRALLVTSRNSFSPTHAVLTHWLHERREVEIVTIAQTAERYCDAFRSLIASTPPRANRGSVEPAAST
jgi:glycosyltransferase involved in cell wall biosynthesis